MDIELCPKCNRPRNIGNSPNSSECIETDDDEGIYEAYSEINKLKLDRDDWKQQYFTMRKLYVKFGEAYIKYKQKYDKLKSGLDQL